MHCAQTLVLTVNVNFHLKTPRAPDGALTVRKCNKLFHSRRNCIQSSSPQMEILLLCLHHLPTEHFHYRQNHIPIPTCGAAPSAYTPEDTGEHLGAPQHPTLAAGLSGMLHGMVIDC